MKFYIKIEAEIYYEGLPNNSESIDQAEEKLRICLEQSLNFSSFSTTINLIGSEIEVTPCI